MFNFSRTVYSIASAGLLVTATLFLAGTSNFNKVVTTQPDTLALGSFVEKDFPFISTSIDARKLGPGFPKNNQAARTLAIKLGDSAYVSFDTDLLRWSVAWTRKFMPMNLMHQVSYDDFFNKSNKLATIAGIPQIATGSYAGWVTLEGNATVFPAPPSKQDWFPLPAEHARWNGVYTYGDKVGLSYTVGGTDILEMPGSIEFDGQTAFTRTFKLGASSNALGLVLAEVPNGTKVQQSSRFVYIYQGANQDTVTALGIAGKGKTSLTPGTADKNILTVRVAPASQEREATVLVWKGPARLIKQFEKAAKATKISLPDLKKGGPAYWKQDVTTQGVLAPDTAAFVTDKLTLPLPNPWKRNVRVADVSFFKDGRAAVITFEGDVWLIDGIDRSLTNLKWRRFASGMHETMSIEVVNDQIYVFGREGIVRLHDLNQDGVADFYENFSNIMAQSPEGREWAGDLVHGPDGSFYVAKGGSLSNGPGVTPQVAKGFRKGSEHNGVILRISPDGRQSEVIATGLRGPYLGIHPQTGVLTASDQQGNFVPSSPIYLIKKGDYYGVSPTVHRTDNPPIAPPLTWIPHHVDQSSIGQAWVTGTKMGPLSGDLVHFSFGRPGLFRVLMDSTSQGMQGGLSMIHADYPAPTSKGAVNPTDGQLYVAGFNLWGSNSKGLSALLRLRYTGKPSYMVNKFEAGKQGIILRFDSPLDPKSATNPDNFQVKRYNYLRTEEYGSGHYKLDGTTGEEKIPVSGSYLSPDGKSVFLLVPEMKEVMQMEVAYELTAQDGHKINDEFWFTINYLEDLASAKYGFTNIDYSLLAKRRESAEKATEIASAEKGRAVFTKTACAGCHSPGTQIKGMYGPPFQGLYGARRPLEDGTTVVADDAYLKESILNPTAKIVKGYNAEMPSFQGILSDTDIESVILFVKSLGEKK
jgi:glucose/arabinose dehydrogenase/cytochrome c2